MTDSINTAMINELKMLMEDDFSILIETYLHDADQRLDSLSEAIRENNSTGVRELAHSLKGSSANLGAQPLADISFKLESMGREGMLDGADLILNDLQAEYAVVREYFKTLL